MLKSMWRIDLNLLKSLGYSLIFSLPLGQTLLAQSFLSKVVIIEDSSTDVVKTTELSSEQIEQSDDGAIPVAPVVKGQPPVTPVIHVDGDTTSDSNETLNSLFETIPSTEETIPEIANSPTLTENTGGDELATVNIDQTSESAIPSDRKEYLPSAQEPSVDVIIEEEGNLIDSVIEFPGENMVLDTVNPAEGTMSEQVPLNSMRYLNHNRLSKIVILIENKEYDLALTGLQQLPEELDQSIDRERQFTIRELKQYLLIQSNYLLGNFEQVVEYSHIYFQQYGNGDNYYRTYYYFASALSQLEKPPEYTSLVTGAFFQKLSIREKAQLRDILVKDAIDKNEPITGFIYLEEPDGSLAQGSEKWVDLIINQLEDTDDIDELVAQYEDSTLRSRLYLKKTRLLVRDGKYEDAQSYLDNLPTSEFEELREFITIALNTEPYKIGVLLPFSHRVFWRYAQQVRDGLELALQEFTTEEKPIQLVFKDSTIQYEKSKSAYARQLATQRQINTKIRDLVEGDKVIAVVGPLTKAASIAAGQSANSYKIPVISFSQTENIGSDLPFLFRFHRKRTQEAKSIADYAIGYLNAKRFVLFYQADKNGKSLEIVSAFESVVKKNGGEIVGAIRIHSKQVDFQDGLRSVTGGLRTLSDKEKKELEKYRERFQADLDFDAVFIESSPESLDNISSFLNLYAASHAWILTGSKINIRKNQLLKYTRKLRFTDAFPIGNTTTLLQPFQEAHWRQYNFRKNYSPPTAYTIFAYEALEILAKLLNNPRHHNRESLKNAIEGLREFPVMTGKVSYAEGSDLIKNLRIFQIKHRNTIDVFDSVVNKKVGSQRSSNSMIMLL